MRRPFGVLWLTSFLFYLGFQLLLPVMPLYAVHLGAREAHVGLIIGVFALDRVAPAERGRAMGTLYTAWELGISGGAILLGLCATRVGYEATWWIAGAIAGLGAVAALREVGRLRG